MSSLFTFFQKREQSLIFSSPKKSCFLKLVWLLNFLFVFFKSEIKFLTILNRYYSMLLQALKRSKRGRVRNWMMGSINFFATKNNPWGKKVHIFSLTLTMLSPLNPNQKKWFLFYDWRLNIDEYFSYASLPERERGGAGVSRHKLLKI